MSFFNLDFDSRGRRITTICLQIYLIFSVFLSGILRDPFSKNGRDPRDPISNFGRDPRDPIFQNNSGIPGSFTKKQQKFLRPAAGHYKSFFNHNFLRDPRDPFSNIGRDPRDPFSYFGLGSSGSFWTSSGGGSRDPG